MSFRPTGAITDPLERRLEDALDLGRLDEAEDLCREAMDVAEQQTEGGARLVAHWKSNSADILRRRGRYDEGEALFKEALAGLERECAPDDPWIGETMNNLGALYKFVGNFDEAAALYERSLEMATAAFGENSEEVAVICHNLGGLDHARGRYDEALPNALKAVAVRETLVDDDHPALAADRAALAAVLLEVSREDEATDFLRRAIAAWEALNAEPPELAVAHNNLAVILQRAGELAPAEEHFRTALELKERILGPDHREVANTLNNLAVLLKRQGRLEAAEPLYLKAIGILEKNVAPDHPHLVIARENLEALRAAPDEA